MSAECVRVAFRATDTRLAQRYAGQPVTAVFDRIEKIDDKLAKTRSYLSSDKFLYPGLCDRITGVPLAKGITSREVPALQGADLIAWEQRKACLTAVPFIKEQVEKPARDRDHLQAQQQTPWHTRIQTTHIAIRHRRQS